MTFIPMIRMAITQYGHNCNIQEDIEYTIHDYDY